MNGDNLNRINPARYIDVTSAGVANTEFSFEHGCGYIPTGFIVANADKAAKVYQGATAWDASKIFLKCDVATVALRILVF